jgi:hypothetical protein
MTFLRFSALAATLAFSASLCAEQTNNLTGNWQLNVGKSVWGKVPKPVSVMLTVEHNEPQFSYRGAVQYANEDTREFGFSGAFDGKPYPMSRSVGEGKIVLQRTGPRAFESTFTCDCGNYTETATTTLSKDGKTLTRVLRLKAPDGTSVWTEIYERR